VDIEPAPSFGARIRTDFIAGMGRVNGKFVIILDVTRVFSVNELADLTGAVAEVAA
jgi:purine-binding chemotaxis protein CheW